MAKPPAARRAEHLRQRYGLTVQDFDALLHEQRGCCAICLEAFKSSRGTHVDHCHRTGRVRGLLCRRCNSAIGYMREDVAALLRAAEYLQ